MASLPVAALDTDDARYVGGCENSHTRRPSAAVYCRAGARALDNFLCFTGSR